MTQEIFENKGFKTILVKVERGNEQEALKLVGGGAIWTDNHGQPIGIAFGGNIGGKGRQFAKYKTYACMTVDTTTGVGNCTVVNETTAEYTRRCQRRGWKPTVTGSI